MTIDERTTVWNLLILNRASREVLDLYGLLDDEIDGRLSLGDLCGRQDVPVEQVIAAIEAKSDPAAV